LRLTLAAGRGQPLSRPVVAGDPRAIIGTERTVRAPGFGPRSQGMSDRVRKPVNIAGKVMLPSGKRETPFQSRRIVAISAGTGQKCRKRCSIVQVYVRHLNRRVLEDLRKHWQKLVLELRARARPGYDFGLPIRQINEEIAVIEAGLERLVIAAKAA
jgi:hypothetical protein